VGGMLVEGAILGVVRGVSWLLIEQYGVELALLFSSGRQGASECVRGACVWECVGWW
jgi:hypothetical protein